VPSHNLGFRERSCFVATAEGLRAAKQQRAQSPLPTAPLKDILPFRAGNDAGGAVVPTWDAERRVLGVGGQIVKQFRVPSPSQEAILVAFEEEGWPAAIDDPLRPLPDQDPKRRLRATLQSLNGGQKNRLIRFRGDGSGERIVWELTASVGQRRILNSERRRAA
jgi:hypothetical protein